MRPDVAFRKLELRGFVTQALTLHAKEIARVRRSCGDGSAAVHKQRAKVPVLYRCLPSTIDLLPTRNAPPTAQDRLLSFVRGYRKIRVGQCQHYGFS
jgi:hypothetical protein